MHAWGFWVCEAGETLAEAACPPIPHAHRKRGKRCAQGNHVSCLRRGLHLIGSWVEYLSGTVSFVRRARRPRGRLCVMAGAFCVSYGDLVVRRQASAVRGGMADFIRVIFYGRTLVVQGQ
jgi:hypothetical protein